MKYILPSIAVLCLVLAACTSKAPTAQQVSSPQSASEQILRRIATIDLPGPPGERFDYLTYDPDDHFILSAHLGAGLMYVIDTRTNTLVKAIPDVPGIEGITYVPEGNKAYTSDWYENKVAIIDLTQMKVTKKLPTEAKPDGSTYATPFHKVYVSDEQGKAETVIDTVKDEIVTTIRFDSEAGVPLYDPVSHMVYVNLQDDDLIAVIDPMTDTIIDRYPVGDCRGNHGMAIDPEHHRLFIACEGNNLLVVFDLDTKKPITSFPLPEGADVVQFDAGLRRVYVACYSGMISVVQEDDADHFRKLADVPVQPKVHSLGIDPERHRIYVPEEEEDGRPVSHMVVYEGSE